MTLKQYLCSKMVWISEESQIKILKLWKENIDARMFMPESEYKEFAEMMYSSRLENIMNIEK